METWYDGSRYTASYSNPGAVHCNKNKAVIDLKNALEIFVQSISEFRTKCPVMRRAYQHFDIGFLRYQEAVVRTEIDDLVIDGRPLPVVANDVPPLEAA